VPLGGEAAAAIAATHKQQLHRFHEYAREHAQVAVLWKPSPSVNDPQQENGTLTTPAAIGDTAVQ
jgi:hypothetical protein